MTKSAVATKGLTSSHLLRTDEDARFAEYPIAVLFLGVFLLYGAGALSPDSFLWGVNHLAFIPRTGAIVVLSAGLLLMLASRYFGKGLASWMFPIRSLRTIHYVALLTVGVGMGVVFYMNRIAIDMYGDSRTLLSLLAGKQYGLGDVVALADHEPLTRLIHQSIAQLFGLDQRVTFQVVSAVCGGALVSMYVWFVLGMEGGQLWKLFLLIIGLTSGVNQLLFGHVEDYTIVYCWSVLFLILAWRVFDGRKEFPLLLAVFLIGTRLHVEMILYAPALVFAYAYSRQKRIPAFQYWTQPKIVLRLVGVLVVVCAGAYIGYFRAYSYETGDQAEKLQKTFLPLFNYLPAPHAYTLFSLSHISDITQEILLVVAPGAIVVLLLAVYWYRTIRWAHPRIIFYALAAFFFLVFDFTMDPFLSPLRDWDLLSLVAAPILFLTIAISEQWSRTITSEKIWKSLIGCALGLGILSSTIFYVNAHKETAAARLHGIGMWAFKGYYQGSAYMVNVAHTLSAGGAVEIREREETIRALEPYASPHDFELGFLIHKVAALLQLQKDYTHATEYYRKALVHDSTNASAWRNLALCALLMKDFRDADHRITVYNENLNVPDVIDFDGLRIASCVQRCEYLLRAGADSSAIDSVLDEASKTIH